MGARDRAKVGVGAGLELELEWKKPPRRCFFYLNNC